jgi:hypothetical protein
MSVSASPETMPQAQRVFSPTAGVLSYLVPGLGQIAQGRVGKGLLFFFALYGLFFYGEYLGEWRNVYIPEASQPPGGNPLTRNRPVELLTDYARFFAQAWIGVAAWPAFVQHLTYNQKPAQELNAADQLAQTKGHPFFGNYQRRPTENEINDQLRNSDKEPDLGWMYTVIAGVLNILVIYDALAGPAFVSVAVRPVAKEAAAA